MSTLTPGQHKQVISAILAYLQEVQTSAPTGVVSNATELSNAIHSLGVATSLSSAADRTPYNIAPHSITSIFAAAHIPAPVIASPASSSEFESKFSKYLNVLKERGYFKDAAEGSPQYEALVEKARAKLLERSEGAVAGTASVSAQASSSTTTTQTTTTQVVTEADKQEAERLKGLGNAKLTAKEFDEAIRYYSDAIALVPNNAVYFANRAAAHSQKGDHESAITDANAAIAADPKYAKAYSRLGLALFSLGRYREAIDQGYSKALKLEPNNQITLDSLATAQRKLAESSSSSADDEPAPRPAAGGPNFADMLSGMMGGAGGNGTPDLGSMFNNPNFMQMAQQMAQNPQFQQMAQQLASNPDMMNNLGNLFGGNRGSGQ